LNADKSFTCLNQNVIRKPLIREKCPVAPKDQVRAHEMLGGLPELKVFDVVQVSLPRFAA
jgi:hypothetical protein